MNGIPTNIYESLLLMADWEFQREYRYIRGLARSSETSKTAVEYVSPIGWYRVDLNRLYLLGTYRTTADEACSLMDDVNRARML